MIRPLMIGMALAFLFLVPAHAAGGEEALAAWWPFDGDSEGHVRDAASGLEDAIAGYSKYVDGVSGQALRRSAGPARSTA